MKSFTSILFAVAFIALCLFAISEASAHGPRFANHRFNRGFNQGFRASGFNAGFNAGFHHAPVVRFRTGFHQPRFVQPRFVQAPVIYQQPFVVQGFSQGYVQPVVSGYGIQGFSGGGCGAALIGY